METLKIIKSEIFYRLKDVIRKIGKSIRDSLFPLSYTCDLCGIETFDGNLCPNCHKTITFNDKLTCPVCGRRVNSAGVCAECKHLLPQYKKAVSPIVYKDGGAALITKFKRGGAYLCEYFSSLIADKLVGFPKIDCIVYVPMTEKALRKRGYNQTALLAEKLSEKIKTPVVKDGVIKIKETSEQIGLSMKEREENLKSCFRVSQPSLIKGKSVLVVDDVMTTGATLNEICSKLKKAQARAVYAATVASVEFKSPLSANHFSSDGTDGKSTQKVLPLPTELSTPKSNE